MSSLFFRVFRVFRVSRGPSFRSSLLSPCLAAFAIFLALYQHGGTQQVLLASMNQSAAAGRLTKDALGYYELASTPGPFDRASLREPLFPFLLRLALRSQASPPPEGCPKGGEGRPPSRASDGVLRDHPPRPASDAGHPSAGGDETDVLAEHLRVRRFTGWIGLGLLLAVGVLGWRVAGPWAGAIAAWLCALSGLAAHYGVSGLRETTTGLLQVALVIGLIATPRGSAGVWLRRTAIVALGAALPLLRLESLAVVPLLVLGAGLWCWARTPRLERHWRAPALEAAAAIVIGWLAVTPFLVACRREFGAAWTVTSVHATYWRNQEFAGQPGRLSREQVFADPYAGPRVTPGQYILGEHGLAQVLGRYAQGYWITLTRHVPILFRLFAPGRGPTNSVANPLVWLWVLGLGWSIARWREYAFVPWAALAVQFPFAFIVALDALLVDRAGLVVELRFSLPVVPFIAVLAGLGVVETVRGVGRSFVRAWPPRLPSTGGVPRRSAERSRGGEGGGLS